MQGLTRGSAINDVDDDMMQIPVFDNDRFSKQTVQDCIRSFRSNHQLKLQLCDTLENLADSLPNRMNVQNCLTLARCIVPTIRMAQQEEETRFFPFILSLNRSNPHLDESIERLCFEHLEDDAFAEEISHLLLDCGMKGYASSPETAGYMLRGFFTSIRRHVAFERQFLIPLMTPETLGTN